jgi:HD-like signal output (HDOD) protein
MPSNRKSCDARPCLTARPSLISRSSISPMLGDSDCHSLPALSNSLLQLELSLSAAVADLRDITTIVRGDVGLTTHLLRLAGCELAREIDKSPAKIAGVSEIVLHIGVDRLKASVARTKPLAADSGCRAGAGECLRFWMHSKLTAMIAEELACQSSAVDPEEAYLAGLLFHLGGLPALLDWPHRPDADPRHIGYQMAVAWRLPRPLLGVIAGDRELCLSSSRTLLDVVVAADSWASRLEFLATRECVNIGSVNRLIH